MEAGLPMPCSLVYLVKNVWVMRVQLATSSSGRLFLSADLDPVSSEDITCLGLSIRVMSV